MKLDAFNQMTQSYESLIQDLRGKLDGSNQTALDEGLSSIRQQRQRFVDVNSEGEQRLPQLCTVNTTHEDDRDIESFTYVGKVSDVHFIHTARRCMQGHGTSAVENEREDDGMARQSYSRTFNGDNLAGWSHALLLPSRDEAVRFLDIYLSTIHLAYPFLCRQTTLDEFDHLWTDRHKDPEYRPWIALFSKFVPPKRKNYLPVANVFHAGFIFAIGSYYMSFPHDEHTNGDRHFRYFEQGVYFSNGTGATCSLTNVQVLLVQCFFLLAVCHTDR